MNILRNSLDGAAYNHAIMRITPANRFQLTHILRDERRFARFVHLDKYRGLTRSYDAHGTCDDITLHRVCKDDAHCSQVFLQLSERFFVTSRWGFPFYMHGLRCRVWVPYSEQLQAEILHVWPELANRLRSALPETHRHLAILNPAIVYIMLGKRNEGA